MEHLDVLLRVKYTLNNGLLEKKEFASVFLIAVGNTTARMHFLKASFLESVAEVGSCGYQIFRPHHRRLLNTSIMENIWFL